MYNELGLYGTSCEVEHGTNDPRPQKPAFLVSLQSCLTVLGRQAPATGV